MRTAFPFVTAAALALVLTVSGCASYQAVSPVEPLAAPLDPLQATVQIRQDEETLFCVIGGQAGTPFFPSMYNALSRRGFDVKLLPPDSSVAACPLTAVYAATQQSYWRTFLASAQITVYRHGDYAGRAFYDSRRSAGGLNLSNWVDPDAKIEELIGQLFPGRVAVPPAAPAAPGPAI